jgi:hypothetical protein
MWQAAQACKTLLNSRTPREVSTIDDQPCGQVARTLVLSVALSSSEAFNASGLTRLSETPGRDRFVTTGLLLPQHTKQMYSDIYHERRYHGTGRSS